MPWLPGWDSLTSVPRVFWSFGIACLVVLVISEVLAKIYADRKNELLTLREGAVTEWRLWPVQLDCLQ
jgi:hypothetical protein